MRYYRLVLLLVIVNFQMSCEKTEDKLFWISETSNQRNDFLFMTESTNVATLMGDSLKLFLRPDEFIKIDTASTTYKNFGQIYEGDKFRVFVFLRSMDEMGRNYVFFIRTFDSDWKVVDDFELAIWNEEKKHYCYGSISANLIIERKCEGKDASEIMQITDDGKIVTTSSDIK